MEKYRVVCKSCNHKMGVFDTPDIEVPLSCDKCGGRKIGVEKFTSDEVEQLDFDLVLVNKRTGVSKVCGFFISKEKVEKNRKNLNKMRAILADEMATSLHTIIKSDTLLVDLLGAEKHEI